MALGITSTRWTQSNNRTNRLQLWKISAYSAVTIIRDGITTQCIRLQTRDSLHNIFRGVICCSKQVILTASQERFDQS